MQETMVPRASARAKDDYALLDDALERKITCIATNAKGGEEAVLAGGTPASLP